MGEQRTVHLAYGETGLAAQLPADRTTVVEPKYEDTAADQRAAVLQALREPVAGPPLRERVRQGSTVAISVCDLTRPQPRELMVRAVLDELDGIVRLEDVVVLVATGTHRANTDAELRQMLGDEIVDTVRVVNHDARDASTLTFLGTYGNGVPVWLNREWVEADVKITTGFVEPHFFAGFSGGPKMITPGLAGLDTVLVLHDAARIGHPEARWGVSRATRCTTTSGPRRWRPAATSPSTSCSTATRGSWRRTAATCWRCTRSPASAPGASRWRRSTASSTSW